MNELGKLKWWCETCDHVAKNRNTPLCPACRTPMTCMGKVWKPGPKGNRMKNYPTGYRHYAGFTTPQGVAVPFGLRVLGGVRYRRRATRDEPMWIPSGTKLRTKRGRIISQRNVS